MSIEQRIKTLESATAAQGLAWLARAQVLRKSYAGPVEDMLFAAGCPEVLVKAVAGTIAADVPAMSGSSAAVRAFAELAGETSASFTLWSNGDMVKLPFDVPLIGMKSDLTAAKVIEGRAIPLAKLTLSDFRLTTQKTGCMIAISESVWRNVGGAGHAYINAALRRSIDRAADAALFEALENSGTTDVTAGDVGEFLTAAFEALAMVASTADSRPTFAISRQADSWLRVANAKYPGLAATANSLLGYPKVISAALEPGELALIDGGAVAGDVLAIEV